MSDERLLYIETWGCSMNTHDSKRMAELLEATFQLKLTSEVNKAHVLLMNTCSIREKAQEKVFSALGRWRALKEANPEIIIGVGGCVASQEGQAIRHRAPYVDIIFGPQTIHRLPALLNAVQRNGKPAMDISFPLIEKFDCLPAPRADGPEALVSIQEGCNKYCSYCIVPYTRGQEVNRPFEDVIQEVYHLAKQGVKEIQLLGQNVNAYQGIMKEGHTADLGLLIRFVAQIPGIERIRFLTSHPAEFSQSLITAYRDVPQLVNHLHLPVQSGSDRILSLMGRAHTVLEYKDKIRQLREYRPDLCISSDFIIGYPGESEADFEATLKLVESLHFDKSFSFIFSPRPGTPAASLPDLVPLEVKQARLSRLQEQLNKQSATISHKMIQSTQRILVTGTSRRNPAMLCGRTENNRLVYFQGPLSVIGQLCDVVITAAQPNSLIGRYAVVA